MSDHSSPFEIIGGEAKLRAIVTDFIERVTSDIMIGFFFRSVDKKRLAEFEFQFARAHLGGEGAYSGRPLRAAHSPHPIMGGHFDRRLRILDQTLRDHGVVDSVRAAWLAHNESLRSHITGDEKGQCIDPLARKS